MALTERRFGGVVALVPDGEPGVVFTTRVGGGSGPPFATLNLGYSTGDDPEVVAGNRRTLCDALGIPAAWVTTRQVHGAAVLEACAADAHQGRPVHTADAVITREWGVPVVALAADCVPVAVVAPRASGVVHAGWRGLAAGAVAAGVAAVARAGGWPVHTWIGPCIGPCHYEVGPEVGEAVAQAAPHAPSFEHARAGTRRFDLRAAARWLLADAGAVVADVDDPPCTWCDARFFSHRRDGGRTGRQAVVVWRPGSPASGMGRGARDA